MELALLGYFIKAHGVKGELLLKPEADARFSRMKAVFVDIDGSKAPYFIKSIRETDKGLLIALEDVDGSELAGKLTGRKVFADASLLKKPAKRDDLTEYEVIERSAGSLGKITQVDDSGPQMLIYVLYRDREVMLPFAEELVERIDRKNRKIFYSAPEGLIDIYLEEDDGNQD